MSIDEIMALADEYVSASIEDHGYRSGAASAEYLEDTKRKLLAALESLIAAPAAQPRPPISPPSRPKDPLNATEMLRAFVIVLPICRNNIVPSISIYIKSY